MTSHGATPRRRDGAAAGATFCSVVKWRRERFESDTGFLAGDNVLIAGVSGQSHIMSRVSMIADQHGSAYLPLDCP
jgi:hypothetical protein